MSSPKTIAFFGASTGVGLSALKHSLAAGHNCVALCRIPAKLEAQVSPKTHSNLRIVEGNAHDIKAVASCLKKDDGSIVDAIVSTIGGKPIIYKMTIDDPNCCRIGMSVLLDALAQIRAEGAVGRPHITVFSTTGMSDFGRDYPLLLYPIYAIALKVPHEDKKIMETKLSDSGEDFTIVRGSLLVDGESETPVRVGIEDPKNGLESLEIGYTISREDAGKWLADNLLVKMRAEYMNKIASITY
ncbi:transcription factor [Fusarium tjaetaba]|uniref:Transcription factor n=1 Tax=Fusarium tjaetaba TaxID=1567544 RepID=A0A8H5QY40_9HYPO|nr:transcription factor [Fusarium tjaetaba]KAF5623304.1 transcription factor [Fusarium tjaetaba]